VPTLSRWALVLAGCFGDAMFSRKPPAPVQHEIVYLGEAFSSRGDASVAERRRRERKTQIWMTCIGAGLALLVLGQAFGISWLVSAVASGAQTEVARNEKSPA
jgi:hypothetical protein